jgi:hypothetical protein
MRIRKPRHGGPQHFRVGDRGVLPTPALGFTNGRLVRLTAVAGVARLLPG